MKRSCLIVPLLLAAGCAARPASAQVHVHTAVIAGSARTPATAAGTGPVASAWFHAAPVQGKLLVGSDGSTYIGVWVDTPAPTTTVRAPLDVALVVDTSGSMSGDKITNARAAATSFLESLADGDRVSLFAFSDNVRALTPTTFVGPTTRASLLAAVNGLQAMGGTNLYAGLQAGENAVADASPAYPIRRVVLISDGRANIGRTAPDDLAALAAQGTETGAQVTAIGVGLDYDENILGTLAVHSSGRMYHLEAPEQMATILHDELSLLGQTVAANAVLEFDPAPGVTVDPSEYTRADRVQGTLRVPLGTLYGGQHREVLLRARVEATGAAGAHLLGTARLAWQDPGGAHLAHADAVPVRCELTADPAAPPRSVDPRVQAMVASYEAAQSQTRAAQWLNAGDAPRAAAELAQAQRRVQQAAVLNFADDGVRGQLDRQAAGISRGRAAATAAAAAPAPVRAQMTRGAALENNADAMHAQGY